MSGPVSLVFGAGGAKAMVLAALTGHDERAAPDAAGLLARLAVPGEGRVAGAAVADLTLGDRDRALAALYAQLYGAAVLADARCTGCGATYEMRFDLDALAASRRPDGRAMGEPPCVTVGEARVRLPVIADLAGTPETLLARLTVEGPVPPAADASAAFEAADPALEIDLAGTCPECGAAQAAPFSITRFLEAALARDRAFLMREVHLLAGAYRWALAEILGLTRGERQGLVRLILGEREAAASLLRRAS